MKMKLLSLSRAVQLGAGYGAPLLGLAMIALFVVRYASRPADVSVGISLSEAATGLLLIMVPGLLVGLGTHLQLRRDTRAFPPLYLGLFLSFFIVFPALAWATVGSRLGLCIALLWLMALVLTIVTSLANLFLEDDYGQ